MTTGRFKDCTRALATSFDAVDALPESLEETDFFELVGTEDVQALDYFAIPVGTETIPLPENTATLEDFEDSAIVLVRMRSMTGDKFYVDIIAGEVVMEGKMPAGTMALAFDAPVQLIQVKAVKIEDMQREGKVDAYGDRMGVASREGASQRGVASNKRGRSGTGGSGGEKGGSDGEDEDRDRDSSALHAGHAEWGMRKALRLKSLLVVKGGDGKDQAMAAALRGEFDAFNYGKLSILSFLPAGASKAGMWEKGVRSEDGLAAIASGLRNHDTWLQVASCEEYEGASAELATSLTQDVDVWSATDNVLVLFIVMHMIAAFYNELRKSKNSVTFPEVFATTGKETAALFKKFVGRLLVGAKAQDVGMNFTAHPHNVFYDEVRGAFHHMQLPKPGGGAAPATPTPPAGLSRSAKKRAK
ncbi:hypothetical protein B484DRAFT_407178, partial [Ochromonadaceae sp. CCMP2298]